MRKFLIWLFGLLIMGLLAFSCFSDRGERIKEKLNSHVELAYQGEGMDWVEPHLRGEGLEISRVLSLEGTAPNESLKEEAINIAKNIYGVFSVVDNMTVRQSEIATIEQEPLLPAQSTEVEKAENDVTTEKPVAQALIQEVLPPVQNKEKEEEKVKAPSPYPFHATKEKSGNIILEGFVADALAHQDIVEKAFSLFGKDKVVDKLEEAIDAPPAWNESISLGLDKLDDVDYGEYTISDKQVHFKGFLPDATQKEAFMKSFKRNLDSYYEAQYDIDTPAIAKEVVQPVQKVQAATKKLKPTVSKVTEKIETCQKRLTEIMSSSHIRFRYNKSLIKATSLGLLDKISDIINSCKPLKIEIGGHTDSDGSASYNQKLSAKRAQSVKKYLVSRGVEANRLSTKGYGETKPIASNKTEAGKKQNRRIEITLKGATK